MEIKQLKHFLAIVETGSFTRGAEVSHLSQPAISASISKLEDELGKPLFIRNRKQAMLTAEGRRLKPSAELIIKEYKAVKSSFVEGENRVNLKLCVASNFPLPKLSSTLADLSRQLPELSFSVTDTSPDKMVSSLNKGEYDLAFSVTYDRVPLPHSWKAIRLEEERYGIAVCNDHPFAELEYIELKDLIHEPFIEITRWEYRNVVIERLKAERIKLDIKHRVDQYTRALSLVATGMGITITPSGLVSEGVTFIPFKDPSMRRYLTLFVTPDTEKLIGAYLI